MTTTLKCPNPSCPYQFDASSVPAGVVLACPRCAMRFTLGPPPAAPAQQYYQAPAYQQSPTDEAFGGMTPAAARADGAEDRPRLPVRTSQLQTVLLAGVAVVALAGAAIAVWYKVTHKDDDLSNDPSTFFKDKNLSMVPLPEPWIQDGSRQAELGSPYMITYRRDNPEAYISIGARDYKSREPRATELEYGLTDALEKILAPGTLQRSQPEETTWLGMPVRGFRFHAQLKSGAVIDGEAYHVSHKGIAYWFLAWTGENEIYYEQKAAFADARKGCKLLDQRKDWKPTLGTVVEFKDNVLGYAISDGEEIWREETSEERIKAEDPRAEKFLTARIKRKGRDFPFEAELVIYVLDSKGDPLEQGRAFIEAKENADPENRGKNAFVPHTEDQSFDEPNPVDGHAPYVLLKSTNSLDKSSRLWAISAIQIGNKTVVAAAKCSFAEEERKHFERKFVVLVRSLRAN